MKEVREHDPSGRAYYDKVCSRMGLVPVSYIKRHITDTDITMRFHGLGATAAKAIALVLRVSPSYQCFYRVRNTSKWCLVNLTFELDQKSLKYVITTYKASRT